MKNKLQKAKGFVKKHKFEIMGATYAAVAFISGCVVATCIGDFYAGRGIERIHNEGFIKFFDPASGNEVDIKTVCGLIKNHFKV